MSAEREQTFGEIKGRLCIDLILEGEKALARGNSLLAETFFGLSQDIAARGSSPKTANPKEESLKK